jgi:predicted nucleic acid-binding protein
MTQVVADASIVVRFLTLNRPNPYTTLWETWLQESIDIVAPALLKYEVSNAMWRAEKFGLTTAAIATAVVAEIAELPLTYNDDPSDHLAALAHARRYQSKTSYDGHYIALALRLECELFTADKRLFNAVQHAYPWVHFVEPE